jgi:hypothetical protein
LVIEPKRPFAFGTADYLAVVRMKSADARGETIGVVGPFIEAGPILSDAALEERSFPVLNPCDIPVQSGFGSAVEAIPELRHVSRVLC